MSAFKTRLCRRFEENGSCLFGRKCKWAHGYEQLRISLPNTSAPDYKTVLCEHYWTKGFCGKGKHCEYIHDLSERKVVYVQRPHKFEMCPHIKNGFCRYGTDKVSWCWYAHSKRELYREECNFRLTESNFPSFQKAEEYTPEQPIVNSWASMVGTSMVGTRPTEPCGEKPLFEEVPLVFEQEVVPARPRKMKKKVRQTSSDEEGWVTKKTKGLTQISMTSDQVQLVPSSNPFSVLANLEEQIPNVVNSQGRKDSLPLAEGSSWADVCCEDKLEGVNTVPLQKEVKIFLPKFYTFPIYHPKRRVPKTRMFEGRYPIQRSDIDFCQCPSE